MENQIQIENQIKAGNLTVNEIKIELGKSIKYGKFVDLTLSGFELEKEFTFFSEFEFDKSIRTWIILEIQCPNHWYKVAISRDALDKAFETLKLKFEDKFNEKKFNKIDCLFQELIKCGLYYRGRI